MLIGWGEADITPSAEKVELAGQYYQRVATEIHSRIKAVAMAVSRGDEQMVMITLDVVGITDVLLNSIREAVHGALPEIRPESIMVNAIHTHSAPYLNGGGMFREWLPREADMLDPAEYLKFLYERIIEAVRQAWESRRPGGVGFGFGIARIGHCRRPVFADGTAEMYGDATRSDFVGMEAGEDSGVEIMFTFDESSKPTGAIVNVACPSQVMEATYKISSDYMGAARELLKKEFGPDFHTLCQISAAGCQSPRDLVRHYTTEPDFWHEDGVPVHAGRVFDAAMRGFAEAKKNIDFAPVFKAGCRVEKLPVRRASFVEYEKAKRELKELLAQGTEKEAFEEFCATTHANEKIPGRPGPYDDKNQRFVQIRNRRAIISRYETQDTTPEFEFNMNFMRLGSGAWVSWPGEIYLHFGQILKARSKARQTFIVQLCNGSLGYLPSPEAERFGGYGGMIINGKVGSDGGYKLVELSLNAIDPLFE